jgi:hypothetical protein
MAMMLTTGWYSSPLSYAVYTGNWYTCETVIQNGTAVSQKPGKIEPPLHVPMRTPKERSLISLLLDAGANFNTEFKNPTPLGLAVFRFGY